jgi:hypothetical protein
VATLIVFVFITVKIYQVSSLDIATALALVRASSIVTVALGSVMAVLPAVATIALYWIALGLYHSQARRAQDLLAVLGTVILLPGVLLFPWITAVLMLAILAGLVIATALWKRRHEGQTGGVGTGRRHS